MSSIKELFEQINSKTKAHTEVSKRLDKSFGTVKNHWLAESGGWSVPKQYRPKVKRILKSIIASQEKKVA